MKNILILAVTLISISSSAKPLTCTYSNDAGWTYSFTAEEVNFPNGAIATQNRKILNIHGETVASSSSLQNPQFLRDFNLFGYSLTLPKGREATVMFQFGWEKAPMFQSSIWLGKEKLPAYNRAEFEALGICRH